jgi:hypothetical protein
LCVRTGKFLDECDAAFGHLHVYGRQRHLRHTLTMIPRGRRWSHRRDYMVIWCEYGISEGHVYA